MSELAKNMVPVPMTDSPSAKTADVRKPLFMADWKAEAFSVFLLVLMAAYFLSNSWRKWPDPIVDSGPQLYAIWQVSEGAVPYHDFVWSYGPFSLCLNALVFKLFGPGLMVLATTNLVFYALILTLAYLAFRMAWGRLGAFAAMAVFISVFSFSHLLAVGNYNFVTPYAAEASHGMALILAAAFIVVKWGRKPSRRLAFLLGLCGGVAAVMKPEFMLAGGLLGVAALGLRRLHRAPVTVAEYLSLAAGIVLPTLLFAAWFARVEPLKDAFIDASQAWWLVVVKQVENQTAQQLSFVGLNQPGAEALKEMNWTAMAGVLLGTLWGAGWLLNRPWPWVVRATTAAATIGLASLIRMKDGWFSVGLSLPGLMVVALLLVGIKAAQEFRQTGEIKERTLMAFVLVLLGLAMLARMLLQARVYHFGFFQAALAGMVVAAMMVNELPYWTGMGKLGRGLTTAGGLLTLGLCCGMIAAKSHKIRAGQTEPVGWGRDRFYSTTRMIDGTGALVNWAAERMRSTPPDTEVLVLSEGAMINYLSRRKSPRSGMLRQSEKKFVEELRRKPPEYVILISRELKEFGIKRFGAPGQPGFAMISWVGENYQSEARLGGDPLDPDDRVGAVILHRKTNPNGVPASGPAR